MIFDKIRSRGENDSEVADHRNISPCNNRKPPLASSLFTGGAKIASCLRSGLCCCGVPSGGRGEGGIELRGVCDRLQVERRMMGGERWVVCDWRK